MTVLFDKFKKRRKYPHNRKAPGPAAAVYAGPEQMNRFRPEEDAPRKVYAGPRPFPGEEKPEPAKPVYAGPEDMEKNWPL